MNTQAPARRFSKPHFAVAMLLPVYPFITALLYVVMPLTEGWTLWQRTALIAPVMVFSIVYVISPLVQKHLSPFFLRAA